MANDKPGPLEDLRVIELADEKCQLTGKLLADLGADTIKIEKPGGDDARRIGPFVDDIPNPNRSLWFWYQNTSKRAITLNIEKEEGRDILKRLVRTADILIEANPVGYLPSLGLSYDDLSKINPRLIMGSLTGWGQTGPYKDWKTSDMVALAMGGLMYSSGYDDFPGTPESQWTWYDGKSAPGERTPPIRPQGYQGYNSGNHHLIQGILAALFCRDMTGEGQYVDASCVEAVNSVTENAMPSYIMLDEMVHRQTVRHHAYRRTPPWHYRCTDDVYIMTFGLPRHLASYLGLIEWMKSKGKGQEEDLEDERLRLAMARGVRPADITEHVMDVMGRFLETIPSQEAYHGGQRLVNPWGVIRSPDEGLQDPHMWDRGMYETVYHEEAGRAAIFPGHPYVFTETPWHIRRRAPLVGEHNVEILCKELGFTKEQLTDLAEGGII